MHTVDCRSNQEIRGLQETKRWLQRQGSPLNNNDDDDDDMYNKFCYLSISILFYSFSYQL